MSRGALWLVGLLVGCGGTKDPAPAPPVPPAPNPAPSPSLEPAPPAAAPAPSPELPEPDEDLPLVSAGDVRLYHVGGSVDPDLGGEGYWVEPADLGGRILRVAWIPAEPPSEGQKGCAWYRLVSGETGVEQTFEVVGAERVLRLYHRFGERTDLKYGDLLLGRTFALEGATWTWSDGGGLPAAATAAWTPCPPAGGAKP